MTKSLYQELHNAVIANKDVSSILNSTRYKRHGKDSWLVSIMFNAIANNREESSQSILEHIRKQESQNDFYSELAGELLAAYNKDKQIAIRVIDFAKKHDILKDLLQVIPDKRTQAKLLEKKDNGEYVHSNDEIVEILKKKRSYEGKGQGNGEWDTETIIVFYSPVIICVGLVILCVATTSGEPNPGQKAMLTGLVAFAVFSFVLISTILLCCYATSSIANYFSNREHSNIVKKLQTQSENQQSSQPQGAAPTTKKQEKRGVSEKDTPSSDSSVTGIAGPQTGASLSLT